MCGPAPECPLCGARGNCSCDRNIVRREQQIALVKKDSDIEFDSPFWVECPACGAKCEYTLGWEDLDDAPWREGSNEIRVFVWCENCADDIMVKINAEVQVRYTIESIGGN